MLVIRFSFLSGRYHATPWGRHVNEADVAWPPDPWRIARALLATWYAKVAPLGQHADATLESLVGKLAASLPRYALPPASQGQTRHYMAQGKAGKTSLVFDAFAAVDRDAGLFVSWDGLECSREESALLDDLLSRMGYLGRSESWVHAERVASAPEADCLPLEGVPDINAGQGPCETITLMVPRTEADYAAARTLFLSERAAARRLKLSLPEGLLAGLCVDTALLRKHGWNSPPAARYVHYQRPVEALQPKRRPVIATPRRATSVSYVLVGKPQPRVEDSLRIGELMRAALISRAGYLLGADNVPPMISGHGLPAGSRHQHVFFHPYDSAGAGKIDRVAVHLPAGIGPDERRVFETLRSLWSRDGSEWRLLLESMGDAAALGEPGRVSRDWISVTPYLHPWHAKAGFSAADQLRRECRLRGLPGVEHLEPLDSVRVGGVDRNPLKFRRYRTGKSGTQPDRIGSFWAMRFAAPVQGPVALGHSCHFGLGFFLPA